MNPIAWLTVRMVPVVSSNIAAIGYNPLSGTLTVAFKNRSLYEYYGVRLAVYADFMREPSKGTFHRKRVCGHYSYRRIV